MKRFCCTNNNIIHQNTKVVFLLLTVVAFATFTTARLEGRKTNTNSNTHKSSSSSLTASSVSKSKISDARKSKTINSENGNKLQIHRQQSSKEKDVQENRRVQQCGSNQKSFDLYISFDLNPSEIQYAVQCDDGYAYLQSRVFGANDVYQTYQEHACLPNAYTCMFTIKDSTQDGLTAGNGGTFQVWENGQLINQYGGYEFGIYNVCCGNNCNSFVPPALPDNIQVSQQQVAAQQVAPAGGPTKEEIEKINKQLHPEFYGCKKLTLTLHLDASPRQVMYELQCSNGDGWYRPAGSYKRSQKLTTVTESIDCVVPDTTCHFTIADTKKNGLAAGGWYKLVYGDTTISHYTGGTPYQQQGCCIGPRCNEIPPPVSFQMSSSDDSYDDDDSSTAGDDDLTNVVSVYDAVTATDGPTCNSLIQLSLTSDEFATEIGYELVCGDNNDIKWNMPVGSYTADAAFTTITETACLDNLPSNVCCTFTIKDVYGDGLVSPENNLPGNFELLFNSRSIASYDGSNPNAQYDVLDFFVGNGC